MPKYSWTITLRRPPASAHASSGVSGAEFSGESPACLADDHQVVHDPCLNQLITVKPFTPLAGVFLDSLDGFQNVTEPDAIVSHSGTASDRKSTRLNSSHSG